MYEDDPVRVYLHEMGKVPPLTRDQEMDCVRRMRAGGEQAEIATKDLVEANLALVVSIAQKYPSDRIHLLDLIQKGNDALLLSARAFASSNAQDFSAYAAPHIEHAIAQAVGEV